MQHLVYTLGIYLFVLDLVDPTGFLLSRSMIPVDLTTNLEGRSMIPVDLTAKSRGQIYDLSGSLDKIKRADL